MPKLLGYPTIIARDKDTGEVVWEKIYKNTQTAYSKYLLMRFFTNKSSDYSDSLFSVFSPAGRLADGKFEHLKVLCSSKKIGRSLGQISLQAAKGEDFSNGAHIFTTSGKNNEYTGTVDISYKPNGSVKVEGFTIFGQLQPPTSVRSISSVLITIGNIHSGYLSWNSSTDNIHKIFCGIELEEEIIQDSSIIIDIYYKIILDMSNLSDIADGFFNGGLAYNSGAISRIQNHNYIYRYVYPYRSIYSSYDPSLLLSSPISSKPMDNSFILKHFCNNRYAGYSSAILGSSLYYLITDSSFYGLLNANIKRDFNICNYSFSASGRIGDIIKDIVPAGLNKFWAYPGLASYLHKDIKYDIMTISSVGKYLNVYQQKLSTNNRPYVDTSNFKTGTGSIKAKMLESPSVLPEKWYIDITETGGYGVAKATIKKRPFLGTFDNYYTSRSIQLSHLTSVAEAMSYYLSGYIVPISGKESTVNHENGFDYINSGDRYALSDGHVAIITRKGVMLTHLTIIKNIIIDKNSTPSLPVSMITSVAYNRNTQELFIGCAETGLWKIVKSFRNDSPPEITKIETGPSQIYAMYTDNYGKLAVVSNRGIEYSYNNGSSWDTVPISELTSDAISSVEDLKKINAIAVDFDSSDKKTLMFFNGNTPYLGACFDTLRKIRLIHFLSAENLGSSYNDAYYGYTDTIGKINDQSYKRLNIKTVWNIFPYESIIPAAFYNSSQSQTLPHWTLSKSVTTYSIGSLAFASYNMTMLKFSNILPGRFVRFSNNQFVLWNGRFSVVIDFEKADTPSNRISSSGQLSSIRYDYWGDVNMAPEYIEEFGFPVIDLNIGSTNISNQFTNFLNTKTSSIYSRFSPSNRRASVLLSSENLSSAYVSEIVDIYSRDTKIIDIFHDTGAAIITEYHSLKTEQLSESSSNLLDGDVDYSKFYPSEACTNSGLLGYAKTYASTFGQPTGLRDNAYTKKYDKYLMVSGEKEFTITGSKISVDGVEIEFISDSTNNSFIKGDYYSFVRADGFVVDNYSTMSVSSDISEFALSDNEYTQEGRIAKTDSLIIPHMTSISEGHGIIKRTRSGKVFGDIDSGLARFASPECTIYGDFKFRIPLENISGISAYVISPRSITSNNIGKLVIYLVKNGDKVCIFPTVSGNSMQDVFNSALTLNSASLAQWSVEKTDQMTLEFDGKTRSFLLKKNGHNYYSSGAMSSSTIPVNSLSMWLASKLEGKNSTGSIKLGYYPMTEDTNFLYSNEYSLLEFPEFEYCGRGYNSVIVGDPLEKTGAYDPKFTYLPRVPNRDIFDIRIDNVPVSKIKYFYGGMNENYNSSHESAYTVYFSPHIYTAGQSVSGGYDVNLEAGEVYVCASTGTVIFSSADVGKKYSIRYRYFVDTFLGLGNFADESEIPAVPGG